MVESVNHTIHPGSDREKDPMFPHAPVGWTVKDADKSAKEEGLTLTDDHWEVIKALQEYYFRHDKPHVRELHDALDEHFHSKRGLKYVYELFPQGPVAQGCRIAGLEAPAGSTDTSFGSVQ